MYTVKEFADYFRLSPPFVYRAIREGTIKAIKIGNAIRISESEVERLATQGGTTPDSSKRV